MKSPHILVRKLPLLLCVAAPAYAGTYGWVGNVDGDWNNALNWTNTTIDPVNSAPVPGTSYLADNLRINNWAVVGTDGLGNPITQTYAGAVYNPGSSFTTTFGSGRGFVLGVGNGPTASPANVKGSASLTVSSGTIVINRASAGTGNEPFMANRADATLLINGGTLDATALASALQFRLIQEGFPGLTSTITVSSGMFATTFLNLLYDAENDAASTYGQGIINLEGTGVIAVNRILRSHGGSPGQTSSIINLNGGTLRSRAANTSFLLDLADTDVFVKAGGAKIDTPTGFGITIAEPLLHDPALGATLDGGLTKLGAAGLTLSATNSTYTGGTTINEGSLVISANGALGDPAGGITFTGGTSNLNITASITDSARPITVSPGATGRLQLAAGASFTTTGKLSGSGTFEVRDTGTGATRSVTLAHPANDFTGRIGFSYATNSQQTNLTVNSLADVSGAGNIFFNSFNNLFPNFSLAADAAAGLTLNNRRIELAGTMGTSGYAVINNASAVHPIVINTDLLITGTAGDRRLLLSGAAGPVNVFDGDIADASGSVVTVSKGGNASTWTLSGNNSFSGGLALSGALEGSQLNLNSATAAGTGTFTITGGNNARIDNTSGAPITLSTNNAQSWNSNFRFMGTHSLNLGNGPVTMGGTREVTVSGSTLTVGGAIGGAVTTAGLRKMGNAVLELGGANTYQGPTTVSFGTLLVNGSLHADSAVTVDNFGTLGGTGSVGGSVTVIDNGRIAPGASAGVLTIGGGLDVSALAADSGRLIFELDALTGTNDRIDVLGALSIGTGTLGLKDFAFTNLGGMQVGTYTLIAAGSLSGSLDATDLTGTLGDFSLALQPNGSNLELVVTNAAPPAPTYASWLAGYTVGALSGFADDADADGSANGLEYFFGTDPSVASRGITLVNHTGTVLTFTHPQNPNAGTDVTATYRWTKNLSTYFPGGATDVDGNSVTFTVQPNTPVVGTTTVTATISGPSVSRIFVSVDVTQ